MGRRAVPVVEPQTVGGWGREEIREWAGCDHGGPSGWSQELGVILRPMTLSWCWGPGSDSGVREKGPGAAVKIGEEPGVREGGVEALRVGWAERRVRIPVGLRGCRTRRRSDASDVRNGTGMYQG